MGTVRVIARLDIKGPNLVKGVHLEGLRVLGEPRLYAEAYYADGIDEFIYMDPVASLYGRNSLTEVVSYTADRVFVPLTVGGGVRSLDDIHGLLRAGADKVAINTAAIKRPELIAEAASVFGSQCVVVSIEAKHLGRAAAYECFTDNGREPTGVDVLDWCRRVEQLGAGEILLTSIDREGTGTGFDLELTKMAAAAVAIPVIASGGCGTPQHAVAAIVSGQADAVAVASVFHYEQLRQLIAACVAREYREGNVNFLQDCSRGTAAGRRNIVPTGVRAFKQELRAAGLACRP